MKVPYRLAGWVLSALMVFSLSLQVVQADDEKAATAAPQAPSQEQQLLQTMAGSWTANLTAKLPDGTTKNGTGTCDLQSTAGGEGVVGTANFEVADLGTLQYGVLFGYDVWTKTGHFYTVGSGGEVHDHSGPAVGNNGFHFHWEGILNDKPSTEDLELTIAKNELTFKEKDTREGKDSGEFTYVFSRSGAK
jgi:hypothetical protein